MSSLKTLSVLIAEVIFNMLDLIEFKLNLILKFPLLSRFIFFERKETKVWSEKNRKNYSSICFLDFKLFKSIFEKALNIFS